METLSVIYHITQITVNNIGDVGALALSEALKENTSITELDLWSEQITCFYKSLT